MNPYQIAGIIAACSLAFAAVVAALVMQGLPVMAAFGIVYVAALMVMIGMQRRAGQSCDGAGWRDECDGLPVSRAGGPARRSEARAARDESPSAPVIEPTRVAVGDIRF